MHPNPHVSPYEKEGLNSEGFSLIFQSFKLFPLTYTIIGFHPIPLKRVSLDPSLLFEIFFHLSRSSTIDMSSEKSSQKKIPSMSINCPLLSSLITSCLCVWPAMYIPVFFTRTNAFSIGPAHKWALRKYVLESSMPCTI